MDLSPKQIVNQLDKYIIGQSGAKKAVAIALRNRYAAPVSRLKSGRRSRRKTSS